MNTYDHATELGLARYGVIASLVRRAMTRHEFNAKARRITESVHRFPDGKEIKVSPRQIRRLVKWYREGRILGNRIVPPDWKRSNRLRVRTWERRANSTRRSLCELLSCGGKSRHAAPACSSNCCNKKRWHAARSRR